ncbi:MAG: DNA repair protein RadA [Propionibacteriaceae bacterium]|nr:DNA repair protein RadA [Propionibacteriaceae bacterium]
MAKTAAVKQDAYQCSECGWTSTKWVGRCGECMTWGSVGERGGVRLAEVVSIVPPARAVPINQVSLTDAKHVPTGLGELDRVLGGGLVPGAVVLLAGEPGVGKSTLLLDVAAKWASRGSTALYVTGEESAAQVRLRAERTGSVSSDLFLAAETDLGTVLGHIEQVQPSLMVVDSVQTIGTTEADGSPGGVSQVREVTAALVRVAKRRGLPVIVVGHVTKDGAIAGPRTMEHLVDVVLNFEGDRHSGFRLVRAAKNRFGPADEVGCFEMVERGIVEVPDPSGLFLSQADEPQPGTCVAVTIEGRRPMLAEFQALVAPVAFETPAKRVTNGADGARVAMILAVLQRKAHLGLGRHDVYVSTVGGARVSDPTADLAIAVAIASAVVDRNFPQRVLALGEVGLAGDLRRVPALERRLAEAARLGFELAIVPVGSRDKAVAMPGLGRLKVVEVASVAEALGVLDVRRERKQ